MQITSDKPGISERVGELQECMRGPDEWPTIEEESVACLNCFRSTHATVDCEYVVATVISESPLKQADDQGVDSVEKTVYAEVKKSCELDDDDLNEAYDELLMQEFNPDAEDFEEHDDALVEQKDGKSDLYTALTVSTARASRT